MFGKTSLILLLMVTILVHASEFKKVEDKIIMSSSSCTEMERDLLDLEVWTKQTGKECSSTSISPQTLDDGTCQADISDCVPSHVLKYQDVEPKSYGPNCFNLALVMKGIIPDLRYVSSEEMKLYMQEPFCRNLSNDEPRQTGDVGVIWRFGSEYHGFIHVSDNLVYSKNGADQSVPYTLQSRQKMWELNNMQSVLEDCQKNEVPGEELNCKSHTMYYRCTSIDDYIKNAGDNVDDNITQAKETLDEIECGVSSLFFERNVGDGIISLLSENTKILNAYLVSKSKKIDRITKEEKIILSTINQRVKSLRKAYMDKLINNNLSDEELKEMEVFNQLMFQSIDEASILIEGGKS